MAHQVGKLFPLLSVEEGDGEQGFGVEKYVVGGGEVVEEPGGVLVALHLDGEGAAGAGQARHPHHPPLTLSKAPKVTGSQVAIESESV